MKGWKLVSPKNLILTDSKDENEKENSCKVKITKSLITLSDVLRYNGEIDATDKILGSYGIGIVSEIDANLFGIEKGQHVFIEPDRECGECINCKNGDENECDNILTCGEDIDGFLTDFITVENKHVLPLPESVNDYNALFIPHVALAKTIIDRLKIQKGDYVGIIGGTNLGIIISELLIYFQAVPILMSSNEEEINIAKSSGIYYTLSDSSNWNKEVSNITGGRMCKNVVYISDSDIGVSKAFSVASQNARIVFTGQNTTISTSMNQAIKKQVNIYCLNSGFKNTVSSINLLANKAVDVSNLKLNTANYTEIDKTFEEMNNDFENNKKIYETVVDII